MENLPFADRILRCSTPHAKSRTEPPTPSASPMTTRPLARVLADRTYTLSSG
ncbi:hypothetical protein L209DRAFT_726071 [Thermothelomyces heterothallicus CBS 203.75]